MKVRRRQAAVPRIFAASAALFACWEGGGAGCGRDRGAASVGGTGIAADLTLDESSTEAG